MTKLPQGRKGEPTHNPRTAMVKFTLQGKIWIAELSIKSNPIIKSIRQQPCLSFCNYKQIMKYRDHTVK